MFSQFLKDALVQGTPPAPTADYNGMNQAQLLEAISKFKTENTNLNSEISQLKYNRQLLSEHEKTSNEFKGKII